MKEHTKNALSRIVCALSFAGVGILHFLSPEFFVKIMPNYLPYHLELVYVSGAVEIIGACGLLVKRARRFAVITLILLLVAVFPANINMACHPEQFASIPSWLLYLRLPLQLLLALWVWSCRSSS